MGVLLDLVDDAIELLHRLWNGIKKIFVKILRFAKNIVEFFKNPRRIKQLKEDSDIIAVSIKENLDNGDYKVVNCLFDKEKNEVVDMQTDAQGIGAENIDNETEEAFGNKAMVILQ